MDKAIAWSAGVVIDPVAYRGCQLDGATTNHWLASGLDLWRSLSHISDQATIILSAWTTPSSFTYESDF
jgi:hypothetical protein